MMDKYRKKLKNLLDASGARVVRRRKHIIYELANGRMVAMSSTPSDVNSSKKAYSDVRRTAAIPASKGTLPDSSTPEAASTETKARVRPPVRDQVVSEDPGIILSNLGRSGVQLPSAPQPKIQFQSVSELATVADDVDSFWKLNADGRTRVLKKLAEGFAEVDVIGTRSYKTSFRGFEWFMVKTDRRDPLLALWGFDWQMPITRSLRINTPDGRVQIIETESKRILEGTAQIAVITVKSDAGVEERAEIEIVGDAPEEELKEYIFHHFIHEPKMHVRDLHFATSQEWIDPKVVRPVVSEMLDVLAERRKRE